MAVSGMLRTAFRKFVERAGAVRAIIRSPERQGKSPAGPQGRLRSASSSSFAASWAGRAQTASAAAWAAPAVPFHVARFATLRSIRPAPRRVSCHLYRETQRQGKLALRVDPAVS